MIRSTRIRRGGLTAAGLLLLVSLSFPSYGTNNAQVEKEKERTSVMEEEKAKVEAALDKLEGQKADTESYVRQLDAEMSSISSQLEELSGQISDKEAEIAVTQEALDQAKAVEEEQYQSMKLRIKYMYEKGDTSFIDLILESKSIAQMLNRAEYIAQISSYDRQMLDEYAATKENIAANEAKLETEHDELLTLQASTEAKQASVEELLAAKQAELSSYETQIASAQNQINAYEQDIAAQESKIQQMEAEIRRQEEEARKKAEASGKSYTVKSLGNTSFIWPCPSSSRITSNFGGRESPTEGASSNHQGIDIGASTGSGKLCDDQSWRRRIYRIYALFFPAGVGGRTSFSGAGDCQGRLHRIFHWTSPAFRHPKRRKLCKSSELCKSVASVFTLYADACIGAEGRFF